MTSRELDKYVRDVVDSMTISDLAQYAYERLYEFYKNNRDLAEEEAKDFYRDE